MEEAMEEDFTSNAPDTDSHPGEAAPAVETDIAELSRQQSTASVNDGEINEDLPEEAAENIINFIPEKNDDDNDDDNDDGECPISPEEKPHQSEDVGEGKDLQNKSPELSGNEDEMGYPIEEETGNGEAHTPADMPPDEDGEVSEDDDINDLDNRALAIRKELENQLSNPDGGDDDYIVDDDRSQTPLQDEPDPDLSDEEKGTLDAEGGELDSEDGEDNTAPEEQLVESELAAENESDAPKGDEALVLPAARSPVKSHNLNVAGNSEPRKPSVNDDHGELDYEEDETDDVVDDAKKKEKVCKPTKEVGQGDGIIEKDDGKVSFGFY